VNSTNLVRDALAPTEHVLASTLRALAAPKRFFPIVLLAVPILMTQGWSPSVWAYPVGIAMILSFVLIAPASYRWLFHGDVLAHKTHIVVRGALYIGIAVATLGLLGYVFPLMVDMSATFLTFPSSLYVCGGLFIVGGFGLGRDIEMEVQLAQETKRSETLLREAEHAQLLAIRSHLDPHFLFNTLNAIAEWCREDGAAAETAILELSSMLRTMMEGLRTPDWELATDIKLARSLARLYAARDAKRFTFEEDIDEAATKRVVPAMITLPLVENAWKHGPARGHAGPVRLTIRAEENATLIQVENGGAFNGPREGGEGLAMVERRLQVAFGDRAYFNMTTIEDRTVATVRLPHGSA
jgi:two-component sensor histidine kinase